MYEPTAPEDGCRVLVDRLWPRGLSREAARIDHWLPDVGPSTELRRWFGHEVERWPEFDQRYRAELAHNESLDDLVALARTHPVTLLFGARDTEHNQAVVLANVIADILDG